MKKTRKIIAGLMAMFTLSTVVSVNVFAEEIPYRPYDNELMEKIAESGTLSDELKEFIKNSEPDYVFSERCKMYNIYCAGTDENGKELYYPGEPYQGHFITPALCKSVGFDENGEEIYGGYYSELVWFDENGNPEKISRMEYLGATEDDYNAYKFIDVTTGDDILIIADKSVNGRNVIAKYGDTNTDGIIDIRDVAALKKDIVKLETLPDYVFTADINSDGAVDVKDLGLLNKYIIKVIDKF